MGKVLKNNLGFLGEEFQYRLIAAFFDEPKFFKDLSQIIDQNTFTDAYLRTIVGVMKEYYGKYDIVPSYDILQMKLGEKIYTEDDEEYYGEIIERLKNTTTEGIIEIENMAERFFQQQNLIRVANEIKKIAGDGDFSRYEECKKLVEEAMSIKRSDDGCESPLEGIDEALTPDEVTTIPTGVVALDECLGGGLDKGKLGLIIAGSGVGKTSMTTCFSANAALAGFKTLQIVFEDTRRDIKRKYFSFISQIETCELSKDVETINEVKRRIKEYKDSPLLKDNIRILRLKVNKFTPEGIKSEINKVINEGFKPDQVVVDYFGCLKLTTRPGQTRWEAEEDAIRDFENIAPELDVALWLPVQGNRESFTADTVEMNNVGGSISKVQVAQVVLSVTKSREDAQNSRATITVLKNRGGKAARQLNSLTFNNGTCTITSDETVFDDPNDNSWI